MSAQHKPAGEWFCDNDSDDSAATADDVLCRYSEHEIIEVYGAREVWRGFGFCFTNEHGEPDTAWYATQAEAAAAIEEIARKATTNASEEQP